MSRREILARNRYQYIVLQHRLEKIRTLLRNLETLGEGMTAMDYEVLYVSHVNHKDKLDERERELEKLRHKYAKIFCLVLTCLNYFKDIILKLRFVEPSFSHFEIIDKDRIWRFDFCAGNILDCITCLDRVIWRDIYCRSFNTKDL